MRIMRKKTGNYQSWHTAFMRTVQVSTRQSSKGSKKMSETIKEFTVMDGNGHSMPVPGYQAANQLAQKYLEHGDVAVIVIRVIKDK